MPLPTMAEDLNKFQFSRNLGQRRTFLALLMILSYVFVSTEGRECHLECQHGTCEVDKCVCDPGWKGPLCQWCDGRVRQSSNSSVITDGVGNYSPDARCTWVIATNQPNTSLRLHLDHFTTECSWDTLYIYDGDSIYDPLLAVFSGKVVQDDDQVPHMPEVVARSGYALVYFYSEAANNLNGFSVSYRVDGCPSTVVGKECSNRGACLEGVCTCDPGWGGPACSVPVCPEGCSGNGQCKPEEHRCECHQGYTGADCSQVIEEGWWEVVGHDITSQLTNPDPFSSMLERSSHATVLSDNAIWVLGGYAFTEKKFVLKYNITEDSWRALESRSIEKPASRYGHSAVVYNGSIYMYGGIKEDYAISSELWRLDTSSLSWSLVPSERNTQEAGCVSSGPCAPIACVGHAAVVVEKVNKSVMLIIFGHSSKYGYLNTVQEYDFEQGSWETVETRGAVVSGVYGHTAVWDPENKLVYIHGGVLAAATPSRNLMSYDPVRRTWKLQTPAPVPRYLHSAIIYKGLLLVFGGRTHNDAAFSDDAKCYSADFLAYDLSCNTWHTMRKTPNLYLDVARYGHSAVLHQNHMYVVGGFNGKMLGSILKYHPGNCETRLTSSEQCLTAYPGVKCIWNRVLTRCESTHQEDKRAYELCPAVTTNHNFTTLCNEQTTCHSCVSNTCNCAWCNNFCTDNECSEHLKGVVSEESCEDGLQSRCKSLSTCSLCHAHQHCDWVENQCVPAPNRMLTAAGEVGESSPNLGSENTSASGTPPALLSHRPCEPTCSQSTSCTNCTLSLCIWCFSQQRCVDYNSYLVSFPYGQCREWTIYSEKCMDVEPGKSHCSIHQTCEDCQRDVACGWCDDGSGTGNGTCMEGGERGPIDANTSQRSECLNSNWFFTECPSCNCNGHSTCENVSQCIQPCANNTEGTHCQHCVEKYFGKPINGGLCKPCMCNDHGDTCNRDTGKCNCLTKGVTGDNCERCDTYNNYFGEPLNGTCFYDLAMDYKFTFNLSKPEDRHLQQINFFSVPTRSDIDTDFDIQCSKVANIKISHKKGNSHKTWIIRNFTGKTIERQFSASEYSFGSPDNDSTTFYVYVSNFTTPMEIMISFSQHPEVNFFQLFNLFS